jgi:LysR family glycine cleavage system transcriptional activator
MRIRSPSLPELHAFAAVVETGSFSRAAQRLGVTQGAVSRAVLRLEARLGLALLERSTLGVHATSWGRTYYADIRPALEILERAIPAIQTGSRQELRVSAIATLNTSWLVPRLPSLQAEHPSIHLILKRYLDEDSMQRDDVDCWILSRKTRSSRWPRHVRATYIIGREIVPICHPSQKNEIRSPADILRFPLLHHSNFPGNWDLWRRAYGLGQSHLKLAAGFDLAAGLIEAVAAKIGVAVVQRCLIERELAENRVAIPLPLYASTGRGYYLCIPRAKEHLPTVTAFKLWLLKQAKHSMEAHSIQLPHLIGKSAGPLTADRKRP